MKKITVFIIMLCSMFYINCFSVFALDHGIYIVPTVTSYKNPDTGAIDDAGSDVALGEAMCRSAVGTNALVEVDSNGKIYVTLRILLKSNISNVKFYTQGSKGGSYSEVKATVMVEDTGADYADYRFEIKDTSFYISPEFYVTPMGRNVKFYVSLNTASATSGSGDFVTSIKVSQTTTEATTKEATTEATTKATAKETTTEATTNTATKEATTEATTNSTTKDEAKENSSETEMTDIKQTASETEESDDKVNDTLDTSSDDETNDLDIEDELADEEIDNLDEEEIESEEDIADAFNEIENSEGGSSKWIILGVIVIIVIAGGIFVVKKKKA